MLDVSARHPRMQEIIRANREAGQHWFDDDTLRFFSSRVPLDTVDGSRYFVSSEQYDERAPRLYTIREAMPDGSIDTVGEFQGYETRAKAISAVRRLLRLELMADISPAARAGIAAMRGEEHATA